MDATSESELRKPLREEPDLPRVKSPASEIDLRSLLAMLSRRWKTIALTMLIVLSAALALTLRYNEKYAAVSLLEVDDQNERLVRINEQVFDAGSFNGRVDTEAEIIASSGVALKAIEGLKLWQTDEFGLRPSPLDRLVAWIELEPAASLSTASADFGSLPEEAKDELVRRLTRRLDVSRRGLTGIIEVEAKSRSPELAARIANTVVEAYLTLQIERQVSSARRAAGLLEERVVELGRTIQDIEDRINRLVTDNPVDVATRESQSTFQQLRRELAEIDEQRGQSAAILKQLEQFDASSLTTGLGGADLGGEVVALLDEYRRLSPGGDPQVAELEKRLKAAIADRIGTLRQELDDREAPLRDALQKILAQPSSMSETGVSLFRLQRESDINRKLYDSYVARLGEVQQRIALTLPNSRVVARAMVPHRPSFPQRTVLGAMALLVAAGLGLVAAFMREHLIGGFSSREQLESLSGVSVLASVPPHFDHPHDAPVRHPLSAYSEAIRRIRIGIESEVPHGSAVVLLTSTVAGEGKSTMAISIARTLAVAGKRTLLIDADLRNPSVHRLLGRESGPGIVECIEAAGAPKKWLEIVAKDPESAVDVIFGAASGLAGSDLLLGSPNFVRLVEVARQKYDVVILDSPPVGVVVDPLVILPLADLVVYVVRFASTGQRAATAGIREITGSRNAKPLMTVLNLSRDTPGGYYYRRSADSP